MSNYRIAHTRRESSPPLRLELNPVCDICQQHRAHGNHTKCSKQRQADRRSKCPN